jgi:hypothetical protein
MNPGRLSLTFSGIRILLSLMLPMTVVAGERPADGTVDFNRDIRPILSDRCYTCHGPDKAERKAELRLDLAGDATRDRDGHAAIVPGNSDESELIFRVEADDETVQMPPPDSGKPRLTDAQIATLRLWIEQGAEYLPHWAYIPPIRPQTLPVELAGFVRNPVDRFILARLQAEGFGPAPEADRVALIRRLSFDLTGLPPTPEEVDRFIHDSSPSAYESLVERLLDSPHYGERMALPWIDVVRFADTAGYHSDNPVNVWPYRDYVIRAFNANKSFDRFTVEQIAGDLLPDGGVEAKIASAYNRLLQTTEEGGAQAKEYTAKYAADRVRNLSSTWLGATMGCAECHDHKFDPISQRDFYALAAFFADIKETAVGKRQPGMPVLDERQAAKLKQLDDAIAVLDRTLRAGTPESIAARAAWESQADRDVEWVVLDPDSVRVFGESTLHEGADGVLTSTGKVSDRELYSVTARTALKGITGFRLEVLTDDTLPQGGPGTAPDGNFILSTFRVTTGPKAEVRLARAVADFAQQGFPAGEALDGDNATGWAVGPAVGASHVAIFQAAEPIGAEAGTELNVILEFRSHYPQHNMGRFRLSATATADPAARWLPDDVRAALAVPAAERNGHQRQVIDAYYAAIAPELALIRQQIAALYRRKEALLRSVPACLVSESGRPRTVRVLPRGNWMDDSGEVVTPAVPQFLLPLETGDRRPTRLDLARWIVSRDNPLTARVFVNRLWSQYFGRGLSRVLDDLGAQGEPPTHPELLDWLAAEFMESGWDVKHIVRLLVTSGTYRQDSRPRPDLAERDPENRLVGRQVSLRLDAELVRDNALAVAGLLSPRVGGPSVFPYQPAGYWDALNFPKRVYQADHGERQYRRGLYVHRQRTFPHPSLLAFDASSREECTVERVRSNIPQQALTLLNDPTYVEAARAFAERIIREGGDDFNDRLDWAYARALARRPQSDEAGVLAGLYAKHSAQFAEDRDGAQVRLFLGVGEHPQPEDIDPAELAAWTSVARAILNLHETMTRP